MDIRETREKRAQSGEVVTKHKKASIETAAMKYMDQGFKVLPVNGIIRTAHGLVCACGKKCQAPGKHPLTRNGAKGASSSRSKLMEWLNNYPNMNLGIATGEGSNLLVIDIDRGGEEALHDVIDFYSGPNDPCILETRTAITGNGRHLYFKFPSGFGLSSRTRIHGVPIDSRANGGFVLAPPSLHISGNQYRWEDENVPIIDAPEWLVYWLSKMENNTVGTSGTGRTSAKLPLIIPKGQRNGMLFRHACGLVKSFSPGQVIGKLKAINQERCVPPLDDSEIIRIHKSAEGYRNR
jgi:putative DNA primase/helicase